MATQPELLDRRTPDAGKERRLTELRREAERGGRIAAAGVRAVGGPMPSGGVPAANASAGYYGLPLLKQPTWIWTIPVYFFVGGAAGAAAIIGAVARWTRRRDAALVRDARRIALAGGAISPLLLIADLGRPARFFNMLRMFKRQSPMSMGAWILVAFNGATACGETLRMLGRSSERRLLKSAAATVADAAELSAAVLGSAFATYTGVLVGVTAVPVWARNVRVLPFHFGMSGFSTAACLLELVHDDPALHRIGWLTAGGETLVGVKLELDDAQAQHPLKYGGSGRMTRAGGLLSGPGALLIRAASGRSRNGRRLAALVSLAGSLITRFAWVAAGRHSATDPRVPLMLPPNPESGEREVVSGTAIVGAVN